MSSFEGVYDRDNLNRAWRWIRSNLDAGYKRYFRHLYSNYAIADTALLQGLHDGLKRGTYEPSHACKLYFPKRSGILRPYSLLTVEDQIVYQAFVNVVAEYLFPKVRHRYLKEVFGHLCAGKSNTWFYIRWQRGYAEFNNAQRQAVADGFTFTASFDLTAFYDSLDYGVLRHFLSKAGCDHECCDKLSRYLSVWTATKDRIYHHHGIPQGPLSSGLLSEVVLQHFDHRRGAGNDVRYLRYVDDIRLYAKSLQSLRQMLVKLDMLSKSVGLFPQSGKIDIHEVLDIEAELKTASGAAEQFLDEDGEVPDQAALRRRLVQLSPRFRLGNTVTEFRFLLARARPSSRLNDRLWRILEVQPELYGSILHYFQKYPRLPIKVANRLVLELKSENLYSAVQAEMLQTAENRLPDVLMHEVDKVVRTLWRPSTHSADLVAILGRWAIKRNLLERRRIIYATLNNPEWWTRAELIGSLDCRFMREKAFADLVNLKRGDKVSDVAVASARRLADDFILLSADSKAIHPVAACILEGFGLLPSGTSTVCGIKISMDRIVQHPTPDIPWKTVFGNMYTQAERQSLWCRAYADTDITSWVNAMDVFNDLLIVALFAHDPSLGGPYIGGNLGGIIDCSALKRKYPAIQELVKEIHEKRKDSALSHPWSVRAGKPRKPTKQTRYTYIRTGRKLLKTALAELAAKW
jgi:hypothetical protein